jgi:hypothetical protein
VLVLRQGRAAATRSSIRSTHGTAARCAWSWSALRRVHEVHRALVLPSASSSAPRPSRRRPSSPCWHRSGAAARTALNASGCRRVVTGSRPGLAARAPCRRTKRTRPS